MFFIYKEKRYDVNVKNVIDEVCDDDYIDALNAFGFIVHNILPENPAESIDFTTMVMLNIDDEVKIEINDEKVDEYHFIDPIITDEEYNLLKEHLECK